MRRLCLLLLMLTLMLSVGYSAHADSAWPIVQRCFGEATPPTQGWTFSGTLLMTSTGRLHAYRQEWKTPHIVVFMPYNTISRGVLSPNEYWYSFVTGRQYGNFPFGFWDTKTIEVYNTVTGKRYSVAWEGSFSAIHRVVGHGLYWLDNGHLLYEKGEDQGNGWYIIDPFTQSSEPWNSYLNLMHVTVILAPDRSAALYLNDAVSPTIGRAEKDIPLPRLGIKDGAWRPDSLAFAAYANFDESHAGQLEVFDLNGDITDRLFEAPKGLPVFSNFTKWSPNAGYLLFAADHVYIADMKNQQVIDTCVPVSDMTAAWSPSSTQFALIDGADGIQIFDLQTWGRYIVGYHNGDVIGWRADD